MHSPPDMVYLLILVVSSAFKFFSEELLSMLSATVHVLFPRISQELISCDFLFFIYKHTLTHIPVPSKRALIFLLDLSSRLLCLESRLHKIHEVCHY